jgi:8-amino-7-oxononanoate synthase
MGGFAAGRSELIDTLIQRARPYIYSTALPAAAAMATLTSLRIAREEEWRRERLRELIGNFRERAGRLGYALPDSDTPIQPLVVGSAAAALKLSAALETDGIMATAIRPPTVPRDGARIRITFTAAHTDADLNQLVGALEKFKT